MNIKLLQDRVLVEVPQETKTNSGLVLSRENDISGLKEGRVIATGSGSRSDNGVVIPLEVKEGDDVLFSYGDVVTIENKKYFLVRESDIAIILNK